MTITDAFAGGDSVTSLLCTLFLCLSLSVSAYSDVGYTASGAWTRKGFCACGPSFRFGTVFYVPGYGAVVCLDRGGLVTDGHLDLYWPDGDTSALQFGRRELQVVVIQ